MQCTRREGMDPGSGAGMTGEGGGEDMLIEEDLH